MLSVAIIEPKRKHNRKLEALNQRVKVVAGEKPDLLIIPRFPYKLESLDSVLETARNGNPFIALFTQTEHEGIRYAQRIDPWTQYDGNPLRQGLRYEVKDFPHKGIEGLDLDMLVLFGGKKIDPESPAFNSIKPGGYLIWTDDVGRHEVFYKFIGRTPQNLKVFGNSQRDMPNMKDCSWYDLRF